MDATFPFSSPDDILAHMDGEHLMGNISFQRVEVVPCE